MFHFRTSSTSVEQARERSYHRALLLSKDKDTGKKTEIVRCEDGEANPICYSLPWAETPRACTEVPLSLL